MFCIYSVRIQKQSTQTKKCLCSYHQYENNFGKKVFLRSLKTESIVCFLQEEMLMMGVNDIKRFLFLLPLCTVQKCTETHTLKAAQYKVSITRMKMSKTKIEIRIVQKTKNLFKRILKIPINLYLFHIAHFVFSSKESASQLHQKNTVEGKTQSYLYVQCLSRNAFAFNMLSQGTADYLWHQFLSLPKALPWLKGLPSPTWPMVL